MSICKLYATLPLFFYIIFNVDLKLHIVNYMSREGVKVFLGQEPYRTILTERKYLVVPMGTMQLHPAREQVQTRAKMKNSMRSLLETLPYCPK
jgi:hypothetical protein